MRGVGASHTDPVCDSDGWLQSEWGDGGDRKRIARAARM